MNIFPSFVPWIAISSFIQRGKWQKLGGKSVENVDGNWWWGTGEGSRVNSFKFNREIFNLLIISASFCGMLDGGWLAGFGSTSGVN